MNQIKTLFLTLWTLWISHVVFAVDEVTIHLKFFNVGQGNGTIVIYKTPENQQDFPALVVDFGSHGYPHESMIHRKSYTQDAHNFLKDHHKGEDVFLVLSHCDRDHYNKIAEVLSSVEISNFNALIGGRDVHLNKGSRKTDSGNFRHFLKKMKRKKSTNWIHFAEDLEKEENEDLRQELQNRLGSFEGAVEVLSMKTSDSDNSSSIILKCGLADHFAVLTGDADGFTLDNLQDNALDGTSILLAAHHGADKEGANEKWLFENSNASYGVFSTGRFGNWKHPSKRILHRFIRCSENLITNCTPHPISCHPGNFQEGENISIGDSMDEPDVKGYEYYTTTYGLYSTYDSGHVHFSWTEVSDSIEDPICCFIPKRPTTETSQEICGEVVSLGKDDLKRLLSQKKAEGRVKKRKFPQEFVEHPGPRRNKRKKRSKNH